MKKQRADGASAVYIRAVVKKTGQEVLVTDGPYVLGIITFYCPYHYDSDGHRYHDNQLTFLDQRLQQ